MQIQGLHQASGIQPINRSSTAKAAEPVQSSAAVNSASSDQLDLSPEAQAISQSQAAGASETQGIRTEKVAALRQAIANGTYETPEKLSAALDQMLDTFA